MEITEALVAQRIKDLSGELEKAIAQTNAIAGGLRAYREMLDTLKAPTPEPARTRRRQRRP